MKNKRTVRVYSDYKHFELIEVNENQVENIKEINRITWRQIDAEKRHKEKMEKLGISKCSLEACKEICDCIADDNAINPLEQIIIDEDIQCKKDLIAKAMSCLTEKQKLVIYKYYFEEKSFRKIGAELGIHFTTVKESLNSAIKKMKNNLSNL